MGVFQQPDRKQPRRSLRKGLYVGSIFIAIIILFGSRISKGRGYSRSDTQETARKTQERLSKLKAVDTGKGIHTVTHPPLTQHKIRS
jgi:hypothetical protein